MTQGTIDNPLALADALQSPWIRAGHTLYLRGGVYHGDFVATLEGTAAAPITIRPYGDEHAIIDGDVAVHGAYTTWQDLEFRYSGWPTRIAAYGGNMPQDLPPKWLNIYGPGTRMLRCVMHDLGGVGWWRDAVDSEIRRCHIYNNGWRGPDRGHGPAIYAQNNADGDKVVADCIICPSYSFTGFQFYGTQIAPLARFHIERNVLIGTRFILGGGMPVEDAHVIGNLIWNTPMQVGYNSPLNGSAEIRGNYIGLGAMAPHTLTALVMADNTVIQRGGLELLNLAMPSAAYDYQIDANAYCSDRVAVFWNGPTLQDFPTWQAAGYDVNGAFDALPTEPAVFVGDGSVTVFNWTNQDSVAAPIAGRYTNALNPVEAVTLAQGDPLPMSGWTVAAPIAGSGPLAAPTFPAFGCFLVE